MRTLGANTNKMCWKCKVIANNQILMEEDFTSLSKIGEKLGFTRNVVNEIANGRRKQRKGLFDTQYVISKIEE
tara:strand:- start:7444 stop:7662 length:219 start_codon:yes stop_codon:yes gene_type:complete